MANTTNFNWETPDDTDLVKDGAAAIRTLAGAIDTSLVDLKGGTTNQVLAKNSNTDMDFKWVADAAGMTNPMTTTGDTIYSSSGSTPARLGIGSTGQVLTVAAGIPSWATPAGASFVGCLAQKSGSQTIANATQEKLTFADTDVYDTDGFHDPASNSSRITIPAGLGGYYLVYGLVGWDASTAGRRVLYITKNNTATLRVTGGFSTATNTVYPSQELMTVVNLSATDYVELEVLQTSGGNLNTDNGIAAHQFGVVKLG
jgi:hypothetical protein